jgi:UDP-glucose 4-epimerase
MSTVVDGIGGEVFQIATGEETTVIELAQCLAQILAAHRIAPIGIDYQGPRAGDVRRNFSDTRKARARLGWHARVGLREGLERATCWFLERAGRVH